jgi:hypothetical protein
VRRGVDVLEILCAAGVLLLLADSLAPRRRIMDEPWSRDPNAEPRDASRRLADARYCPECGAVRWLRESDMARYCDRCNTISYYMSVDEVMSTWISPIERAA